MMMAKVKAQPKPENGHQEPSPANRLLQPKPVERAIKLVLLDLREVQLNLVGDTALICHAWDVKAKRQMLDKQMGVATAGREKKNPESDFENSLYQYPGGGYGFPATAFKSAAVTACTSLDKAITKIAARQAFHVHGFNRNELVKIEGIPTPREDMVRVGQGSADIRFRGEFKEWSCTLNIRYNAKVLTLDQIVNLFNVAGFAVGVGEWRPQCNGQYGLFHVA
jgi:hypothetical protein